MNKDFLERILARQRKIASLPSNEEISGWAMHLLEIVFPEKRHHAFSSTDGVHAAISDNQKQLQQLLLSMKEADVIADLDTELASFYAQLPEIYRVMQTDAEAILTGDPAATEEYEVIRTYPGFLAIAIFRIAHLLYQLQVPLIPRILTEFAHSRTGIDIHPGATIGDYLYIDHGTGLVIGETCVIGHHVKLYQGVTLGALSVEKYMTGTKRHPTIGDHVIIYAGATILGGDTHIGDHALIGGNVWLTTSVDAYTRVYHQPNSKFIDSKSLY